MVGRLNGACVYSRFLLPLSLSISSLALSLSLLDLELSMKIEPDRIFQSNFRQNSIN